jgi:hypothetical protein
LQVRKTDLVRSNNQLSEKLKNTMVRSDELKNELKAIENIVLEYEKVNRNVMEEIELQAN